MGAPAWGRRRLAKIVDDDAPLATMSMFPSAMKLMRGLQVNGPVVRAERKALGLTQEGLAAAASCDVKTIRNAEKGLRVDAATIKRVADALQQSLAAIIASGESPQQLTEQNIAVFWAWQNASNARDLEGMVRCYDDDATVHIVGAEGLPGGGEFQGLDAIRAQWRQALDAFQTEELTKEKVNVDAVGDFVFARATATAVIRATGQSFTSFGIHELFIQDGKIHRHTIAVDTGAIRRSMT